MQGSGVTRRFIVNEACVRSWVISDMLVVRFAG
jgi:hypothetical protein